MDLKKWRGMYDSYENVYKRFQNVYVFRQKHIPRIFRIPIYGPRVHEKYRKSVSFNHLPDRLVLVIHGAVRLRQVAYEATVPCVASIVN